MRLDWWFVLPLVLLTMPLTAYAQPAPKKSAARLDNYGDALPEHAVLRIGTARLRPGGVVMALAFTPDDKGLVTINGATGGHVWDVATGKEILAFGKAPYWQSANCAISTDGSLAAIVVDEKVCQFYNTATGRELTAIQGSWKGTSTLCISPNKKLLASAHSKNEVQLWSIASGEILNKWRNSKLDMGSWWRMAFSPDSRTLAVCHYGRPMRVWEVPGGNLKHDLVDAGPQQPGEVENSYESPAYTPDGKFLAATNRRDNSVCTLWHADTGGFVRNFSANGKDHSSLGFSPDGKQLASGDTSGEVTIWDVATGKQQRTLSGHHGGIRKVVFSGKGKWLATASSDHTIRIWNAASGQLLHQFDGHQAPGVTPWFTDHGKAIVSISAEDYFYGKSTAENSTLRFWDPTAGKLLRQHSWHPQKVRAFDLTPDGCVLAFAEAGGRLRLRKLDTGKDGPELEHANLPICEVRLSPDGRFVAGVAWHGSKGVHQGGDFRGTALYQWDTTTGKMVFKLDDRPMEALSCRFTDDSRRLVIHTTAWKQEKPNNPARLALHDIPMYVRQVEPLTGWDTKTGVKIVGAGPELRLETLGPLSPSGRLVATRKSGHGTTTIYELSSGQDALKLEENDQDHNSRFSFLASSSVGLGELQDQLERSKAVAFSPDGRIIAVGDRNGDIQLYQIGSKTPIAKMSGHSTRVHALAFSPDGKRIVSGSDDTTILVWDVSLWTDHSAKPAAALGKETQQLWLALSDADAAKARAAMLRLMQSPKEAVAIVGQHLQPIPLGHLKGIKESVANLSSKRFADREQAQAKLEGLGFDALSALQTALQAKPTLEARLRIELLLSKLDGRPLPKDMLRHLRALEVVEMLSTQEAIALLESLAAGESNAWLTQEAAASLARVLKRIKASVEP